VCSVPLEKDIEVPFLADIDSLQMHVNLNYRELPDLALLLLVNVPVCFKKANGRRLS